jgi:hypothetical protein
MILILRGADGQTEERETHKWRKKFCSFNIGYKLENMAMRYKRMYNLLYEKTIKITAGLGIMTESKGNISLLS